MIIEISGAFANLNDDEFRRFAVSFKNCIFAHRQGWHIFAPSRALMVRLLATEWLTEDEKALIHDQILNRYATLAGQVKARAKTILGITGVSDSSIPSQRQIPVEFSNFATIDAVMPSRLLVEDMVVDGRFVREICELIGPQLGYYGPLALDMVHGGGGGMSRLYAAYFNDARPLLCIVDSDRKFHGDRLGETARQVVAVGHVSANGLVRMEIWPTREIENIVPISFLFDVFANDNIVRRRITAYYNILKTKSRDQAELVIDFVDLKNGVSRDEIEDYPEPHRTVFLEASNECGGADCRTGDMCRISQNVVAMTLRLFEMSPRFRGKFVEKFGGAPHFHKVEDLFELVLSFGASMGRIPYKLT